MSTLNIELKTGVVKINLREDLAPRHVEQIKRLTNQGFYNNLKFHRVIDGFMAQTGCPNGNGMGGSGQNILAEFTNNASFGRGTVGMARSQHPNSADSQFFICFAPTAHLNGQYTIVGEVVQGMEHVDQIKKGDPRMNGVVSGEADRMIKVWIED